jgi:hypothetical protein
VSATFVAQLRTTTRPPIQLAESGPGTITLRVEASDIWETLRVIARPETPVSEVKKRVVDELFPSNEFPDEFVLKLRGWEVLDENSSLADSGVVDGSILLLAYRRRRAVR